MIRRIGGHTLGFEEMPSIIGFASITGKKESEGPLGKCFDKIVYDSYDGNDTYEQAESMLQSEAVSLAMNKANVMAEDIDCIFAGDLLNQCISSSFGLLDFGIPYLGQYGACSTMAQGLIMAAVFIESSAANIAACVTSSHFASAERQYRFPLEYGGVRTPTAQWTVTGAGSCILKNTKKGPSVARATIGRIVDLGVTDANNMGAAMATAAADIILTNLKDFNITPEYYDLIITGALGYVGKELTIELLKKDGIDISNNYTDCGIEIYDRENQDTHSGGSGCACSAVTFSAYFYNKMKKNELNRILFVPTGALMSSTSVQQGESIPGIAHAVIIENHPKGEL